MTLAERERWTAQESSTSTLISAVSSSRVERETPSSLCPECGGCGVVWWMWCVGVIYGVAGGLAVKASDC